MGETEQGGAGRLAGRTVATLALVVLVVLGSRLLSPATGTGGAASVPLWTLVPVAYLAGVLALLSPCSGAILPAFFAYGLDGKGQLVRRTYVFYLGLALVFVPVSGASSLVNDLVLDHQDVVFAVGGAVLIAFGLVALLGVDLGRLLAQVGIEPSRVGQGRVHGAETEDGKLYLLGAVFGFATSSSPGSAMPGRMGLGAVFGFATSSFTAPILGSLVALTVSTGLSALAGVGLFLVFGLGIVTPLFAMAVLFEDSHAVRRVAGADPITLRVGRFERRFHPVHLVTGTVLILLGIVFIVFRGTLALTELYTRLGLTDTYDELNVALQSFAASTAGHLVAAASIALLAAGAAYLAWRVAGSRSAPG